jgi:hypothetical protein
MLVEYLLAARERRRECNLGNFTFWSWERILSNQDAAGYGGPSDAVIVADWLIEAEFPAVLPQSGLVMFLGGVSPILSETNLSRFLELVLMDPTASHST